MPIKYSEKNALYYDISNLYKIVKTDCYEV